MRTGFIAALAVATPLAVIACSHLVAPATTTAQPTAASDTSLFAAVARAIADSSRKSVSIDPRPFRAELEVDLPSADDLAPVSADTIAAHQRILRELGIPMADATLPPHCAGTMVPDAGSHAGCPTTGKTVDGVGLPRSRSDAAPPGLDNYKAIRVVETALGPGGFSAEGIEYIFAKQNGRWALVKLVLIWTVE